MVPLLLTGVIVANLAWHATSCGDQYNCTVRFLCLPADCGDGLCGCMGRTHGVLPGFPSMEDARQQVRQRKAKAFFVLAVVDSTGEQHTVGTCRAGQLSQLDSCPVRYWHGALAVCQRAG